MKATTKHLSDILQRNTGLRLKPFVEQHLHSPYPNFSHRHTHGKIHVRDYIAISIATGISLDEIIMGDPQYQEDIENLKQRYILEPIPEFVKKHPIPPEDSFDAPEPEKKESPEQEEDLFFEDVGIPDPLDVSGI